MENLHFQWKIHMFNSYFDIFWHNQRVLHSIVELPQVDVGEREVVKRRSLRPLPGFGEFWGFPWQNAKIRGI